MYYVVNRGARKNKVYWSIDLTWTKNPARAYLFYSYDAAMNIVALYGGEVEYAN